MESNGKLWSPSPAQISEAALTAFAKAASQRAGRPFAGYFDLHRWSIGDRAGFWNLVWDFCGVIGDRGERVLIDGDKMPGASFFPDATLNFAENLLRSPVPRDAIIFRGEDKVERRLSWDELRALVSRLQQAMRALGVKKGDRVAAMLPNMPEAIAGMLAAASIGAIWSSCSPDFGGRRRARPLRPDRAGAVHRVRRLLVQRQAERRFRQGEGGAGAGCRACAARYIVDYLAHCRAGGRPPLPRAVALDAAIAPFEPQT